MIEGRRVKLVDETFQREGDRLRYAAPSRRGGSS